jgi:hypothetical protein
MPASEVIFGGVESLVTVERIPLNVVSLVDAYKYRSVTVEGMLMLPLTNARFGGVTRVVTVEGIPFNVVILVELDKSR